MRVKVGALAAVLTCAVLAGCSGSDDGGGSRYASVSDLRRDAMDAGLVCPDWEQDDAVTVASESGTCGGYTILMVFDSDQQQTKAMASMQKAMRRLHRQLHLPADQRLVGNGWIISSDDKTLRMLEKELGGRLQYVG